MDNAHKEKSSSVCRKPRSSAELRPPKKPVMPAGSALAVSIGVTGRQLSRSLQRA